MPIKFSSRRGVKTLFNPQQTQPVFTVRTGANFPRDHVALCTHFKRHNSGAITLMTAFSLCVAARSGGGLSDCVVIAFQFRRLNHVINYNRVLLISGLTVDGDWAMLSERALRECRRRFCQPRCL